jgi:hypothetical protein
VCEIEEIETMFVTVKAVSDKVEVRDGSLITAEAEVVVALAVGAKIEAIQRRQNCLPDVSGIGIDNQALGGQTWMHQIYNQGTWERLEVIVHHLLKHEYWKLNRT